MGHMGYRLRAELRRAWPGAVAIVVLLAVLGGGVLASAAGARRTASAYPRLLAETNAEEILVSPAGEPGYDPTGAYAAIAELDGVVTTGAMAGVPLLPLEGTRAAELNSDANNSEMSPLGIPMAPLDDRAFRTVGRPSMVEGRPPAPDSLDEAVVSRRVANATGLAVGDTLDMVLDPEETDAAGLVAMAGSGDELQLTITGIAEYPSEVVPFSDLEASGTMLVSEAIGRRLARDDLYFEGLVIDVAPGVDTAGLIERIGALAEQHPELKGALYISDRRANAREVEDGMRPLAVALAAFATVLGLATTFVVGQATARHVRPLPDEAVALAALGATRRERAAVALARAGLIGAGGAFGAVVVALALSNRFPIGPARLAEPDPGWHVDWPVILIGAAGVVLVSVLAVVPSIVMATNRRTVRPGTTSRVSTLAAQVGLRPPAVQGVRFAADRSTNTRATPTRSTVVATAVAVGAVIAATTFAASLAALVDTPARYGQSWDRLVDGEFGPAPTGAVMERFGDDPRVTGIAVGSLHQTTIDGVLVPTVSMATIRGETGPTAVEGRPATGPGEVALGGEVLEDLGLEIGDTVELADESGERRPLEVVGEIVFPHFNQGSFARTGLGEGAQVHTDELSIYLPEGVEVPPGFDLEGRFFNYIALDLEDADALDDELGQLQRDMPDPFLIRNEQRPTTIADLDRVRTVPVVLAVLLALSAGALLSHLLVTAVRSRRRDLALLASLGFTRRQLRATVGWHASTVVGLALAVGIPAGVVVGRSAWSAFATGIHTSSSPVVPVLWVAATLPVALLVANAVAALPGRWAARTQPAITLREE